MATVGILNVGAGDTKLSFDKNNPQECIRAARIVKDMLRRGYALLVDSGKADEDGRPIYTRAYDFDETKFEYIIADFDPLSASQDEQNGADDEPAAAEGIGAEEPKADETRPKLRRMRKRVAATSVNAVAVARSAGG
jgi:hypothetical protein